MKNKKIGLLHEDFTDFEIGDFPYDREHSAMGEYHLYRNEGYHGGWYDPVVNYTYRGPSWIITEDNGMHFMEQMRIETDNPHKTYPTLVRGDLTWKDYTFSAVVRPLNTKGIVGIGFCYTNSLNTLVLALEGDHIRLTYRHKAKETVLAKSQVAYDCDHYYKLTVKCMQDKVECYLDEKLVFSYQSDLVARGGKVALTATVPAQFTAVKVDVSKEIYEQIQEEQNQQSDVKAQLQKKYPKMKLYKTIDLKNFGTGRQIRFGHLAGSKEWFIVLAQVQKRVYKDAYAHISCLTAIDLEGNILWQKGKPSTNPNFAKLTADVPMQVYDIDHDGNDEVIVYRNFELLILDGATGEVKQRAKTPLSDDENSSLIGVPFNRYAFDRINVDSIRITNFSGNDHPSDILIKDRYSRVYVLNSELELLWKYKDEKNTGHYPYAFDIDGDGKDELFCGYNLLDDDGKLIWTLPIELDHTDEIVVGKFNPNTDEKYLALASGTEGFMIVDLKGNIIFKDDIGHAQRVSVGNYCPEKKGYEICVTNYWGHQGIIYLYDYQGNTLWEKETGLNGNIITPVNWVGDGADLILLNADIKDGGLLDGDGNTVVGFPDDGHPELCVEVIDLIGDGRDEIVVWDQHKMYIYTQDNILTTDVYEPVKYPNYNASNYRGEYSFPDSTFIL